VQPPPVPPYGDASLAGLVPALLGAIAPESRPAGAASAPAGIQGSDGSQARLGAGGLLERSAARSACLLLVDGLGDALLTAHADAAPTLAGHRAGALSVGFPSTTATSIASIGTARPPGEHGVVGYRWQVEAGAGVLNALRWTFPDPAGPASASVSALQTAVPERVQPEPTAFERAGVPVTVVAPPYQRASGLTRAVLRGGRFAMAPTWGVLVTEVVAALRKPGLVYAYVGEVDLTGHVLGPASPGWRVQLELVDRLVAALAERLPAGALLAVTGDHGMVEVAEQDRVDLDRTPELLDGVRAIGGEARARYVYARPGAAADVLATWRELLGDRAWVVSADEAVAAGWFGPTVADRVRPRIGDVVAAAYGPIALIRSAAEPIPSALIGQHGSFTPAEQFVPMIIFRP
jgi:hypothetical protein